MRQRAERLTRSPPRSVLPLLIFGAQAFDVAAGLLLSTKFTTENLTVKSEKEKPHNQCPNALSKFTLFVLGHTGSYLWLRVAQTSHGLDLPRLGPDAGDGKPGVVNQRKSKGAGKEDLNREGRASQGTLAG